MPTRATGSRSEGGTIACLSAMPRGGRGPAGSRSARERPGRSGSRPSCHPVAHGSAAPGGRGARGAHCLAAGGRSSRARAGTIPFAGTAHRPVRCRPGRTRRASRLEAETRVSARGVRSRHSFPTRPRGPARRASPLLSCRPYPHLRRAPSGDTGPPYLGSTRVRFKCSRALLVPRLDGRGHCPTLKCPGREDCSVQSLSRPEVQRVITCHAGKLALQALHAAAQCVGALGGRAEPCMVQGARQVLESVLVELGQRQVERGRLVRPRRRERPLQVSPPPSGHPPPGATGARPGPGPRRPRRPCSLRGGLGEGMRPLVVRARSATPAKPSRSRGSLPSGAARPEAPHQLAQQRRQQQQVVRVVLQHRRQRRAAPRRAGSGSRAPG